jgi:hypothetical protein
MADDKNIRDNTNNSPENDWKPSSGADGLKKDIRKNLADSMQSYATSHPGSFQQSAKNADYTRFIQDYLSDNRDLIAGEYADKTYWKDIKNQDWSAKSIIQHVDYFRLFATNAEIDAPLDGIVANLLIRGIEDKLSSYDSASKVALEPLIATFKNQKNVSLSQLVNDIVYSCDQANLSPEQKDAVFNFSIDNNTFLDALRQDGVIDTKDYQTILKQPYAKRPDNAAKIFGMLFTQEVFDECKDGLLSVQESGDAMQDIMWIPNLATIFPLFAHEFDQEVWYEWRNGASDGKVFVFDKLSPEHKKKFAATIVKYLQDDYDVEEAEEAKKPQSERKKRKKGMQQKAEKMWLDWESYKKFVADLYDLDAKELHIAGADTPLRFVSKDITGDRHIEDGAGDNPFESLDKLPIAFVLDVNDPFTKHFAQTYCKGKNVLGADELQWIHTAYAMQNNNRLSAEDKKKLLPHQTDKPTISPHLADLSDQTSADYESDLKQTVFDPDPEIAAQQKVDDKKFELDAAKDVLSKIPGGGKFEKWSRIMLQCCDSVMPDLGGSGGFVSLTLDDCDDWENPSWFTYTMHGVETELDGWWEGKKSKQVPFSANTLEKLVQMGNGQSFILPPVDNVSNLVDYVKNSWIDFGGNDQFKVDKLNHMKDAFSVQGTDVYRDGAKVQYFGKEIKKDDKSTFVMFKVEFDQDSVTLKDVTGWYDRTMNFADFLMFTADKWLSPYTQKQYDLMLVNPWQNVPSQKSYVFWMTPGNIWNGLKKYYEENIVAGIKKNEEAKAEKIKELLYDNIGDKLDNIPFWGEYFHQWYDDWGATRFEKRSKEIDEWQPTKTRLGVKKIRWLNDFKGNHIRKGIDRESNFVKINELFDAAASGKFGQEERQQWFAGMMYCMESFKFAYPRNLGRWAGKHMWAKLLLTPFWYQQYITRFNERYNTYLSGIQKGKQIRDDIHDLAAFEMNMIKEMMKNQDHRWMYSDKKVSELQRLANGFVSDDARKNGLDVANSQGSFEDIMREEVEKKFGKELRVDYAVWAIQKASQLVRSSRPQDYYRLVNAIMSMILNGSIRWAANKESKKQLRDMCRKHGIPLGEYILDNARGPVECAELLELISSEVDPENSFKKATGWTPLNVDYEHWSDEMGTKPNHDGDKTYTDYITRHMQFSNNMKKWFTGDRAVKIMKFLEFRNLWESNNLLTIRHRRKNLTVDQQKILDHYIGKCINADITDDYGAYNRPDQYVNDNMQEFSILNTHKVLFLNDYIEYGANQFGNSDKNESADYFWASVEREINKLCKPWIPIESVEHVFKKYYTLLQREYGDDNTWFPLMLSRMKSARSEGERKSYAKSAISDYIIKNRHYPVPPRLKSGLEYFEKFFVTHIDSIDKNMVNRVMSSRELWYSDDRKKMAVYAFEHASDNSLIKNKTDAYKHKLDTKAASNKAFEWLWTLDENGNLINLDDANYKPGMNKRKWSSDQDLQFQEEVSAQADQESADAALRDQAAQEEVQQREQQEKEAADKKKKEEEKKKAEEEAKIREEEEAKANAGAEVPA